MKKTSIAFIAIIFSILFVSCQKDEEENNDQVTTGKYIINYGNFSGAKSTVSVYNYEKEEMVNNYYKTVNGVDPISNYQYAYDYNGKIFLMGNNLDMISYVDNMTLEQNENGITNGIVKPRYCIASGNILYVSCWGGDIWFDNTTSYIAKIDLEKMEVSGTIALPGGPEGIEIANGKLYAALNYMDSIAVINLDDDAISYIPTPSENFYFVKDQSDNLYMNFSSYDPIKPQGLAYINTTTDELETYMLSGVSTTYASEMAFNSDKSKLYVVASSGKMEGEVWVVKGSIAVFDVASKAFEENMFVEGITGLNAVSVDKSTDNVFVLVAENVTSNGKALVYKPDGSLVKEFTTGIGPNMLITVE